MKIDILTLFPEMFNEFLSTSIIKRAIAKNAV
ncbi:MAG: tRNA (guanosine(37)-N1)-methyltransferase TrmD, partial [Bacilli bacterium]|nr:tRNA (guanosine(37)-N1)-methyltransferase TrmD [Bacilli bacterium]